MSTSKPENVTKVIYIKKDQYFTDALKDAGYDNIPSNVILDKTLTGIGATYTEIKSKRNSIIIEPNVPVIIGKTKGKDEILGVYEKCYKPKIVKYLKSDIQYKKIIITPESFWRIKEAADELNIDIYKDYFCLFDECEKIMQDVEYRENITQPIYDFFKFDQKAFVSATPLTIRHAELKLQNFERIKIIPNYNYEIDIQIIGTDRFNDKVSEKLQSLNYSRCICVFYNSMDGINKIISSTTDIKNNYKIFCSAKSKIKMIELGFSNTFEDLSLPLAKYNFFTSRFFSAVDIELPYNPDIIILTDLKTAKHTMVDPLSEVIQIQGRFRTEHEGRRFNSLTHISNFEYTKTLTNDEIKIELEEWKITYLFLKGRFKNAITDIQKNAIEEDLTKCSLNPYLNKDHYIVNDFAVVNRYNEERVKGYYSSSDKLMQAYSDIKIFNTTYTNDISPLFSFDLKLDDTFLRAKKSRSEKEKIRILVEHLDSSEDIFRLRTLFIESLKDYEHNDIFRTVIDSYNEFGSSYFNDNKTIKTIRKELNTALKFKESQLKRFNKEIIQIVIEEFTPYINNQILQKDVKDKLQILFNRYDIINKTGKMFNVTNAIIKDYFIVKTNNAKQTFTFVAILPEIEKIALT